MFSSVFWGYKTKYICQKLVNMKLILMTLLPRLERNNNFIGKAYSSTINFKLSNAFTNIKIHHKIKKPSEMKFWFKAEYIYIYIRGPKPFNKKNYSFFSWRIGLNFFRAAEPLRGDSLLLTTKS